RTPRYGSGMPAGIDTQQSAPGLSRSRAVAGSNPVSPTRESPDELGASLLFRCVELSWGDGVQFGVAAVGVDRACQHAGPPVEIPSPGTPGHGRQCGHRRLAAALDHDLTAITPWCCTRSAWVAQARLDGRETSI